MCHFNFAVLLKLIVYPFILINKDFIANVKFDRVFFIDFIVFNEMHVILIKYPKTHEHIYLVISQNVFHTCLKLRL